MAVLLPNELAELRQRAAGGQVVVDYTKPTINAALQAIEDWVEANRAALGTAINTTTAPYVFSPAMKKRLFAHWCRQKFRRENV